VAKHVYGQYSLSRIKLLNLALDSLEISENGKISLMTLTHKMLKKTGTQNEDIDGMINYARRIKNVKVAVLIQEYRNGRPITGERGRYHVSLRSDGSVDVANIALSFGGGGHVTAAGFCTESHLSHLERNLSLSWRKFFDNFMQQEINGILAVDKPSGMSSARLTAQNKTIARG
jgi:bifunctional oligoribonuclease and PAP phosphatase NrnA